MALKTKLTTINGASFATAILVIMSLNDSRGDNYQYNLGKAPNNQKNGELFTTNVSDRPQRRTQYQVWIFGDEEKLRDGLPAVGYLYHPETKHNAFLFDADDNSELTRVEQAYENLKTLFPDAVEVDISDLGAV